MWTDVQKTAGCALLVAAVAVPIGVVGWVLARRTREPTLPPWHPRRVPWTGAEVVLAFLVLLMVVPPVMFEALTQAGFFQSVYGPDSMRPAPPAEVVTAAAGGPAVVAVEEQAAQMKVVRILWAALLGLPLQLGLAVLAWKTAYPKWQPPGQLRQIPTRLWLAVLAWLVLTPLVHTVHVVVNVLFLQIGWTPQEHDLTRVSGRPVLDQALFVVEAAAAAPLVEELLFRGILLPWLVGGAALGGNRPAWRVRVWLVLGAAVCWSAASVWNPNGGIGQLSRGPLLFTAGLAAGWGVLSLGLRRKQRTAGAIYASAALFAAIHSTVWPTPIPLFVLGLGLGWLAVRTRGFLVPAVVHGLFNAVSVLLVLRGG